MLTVLAALLGLVQGSLLATVAMRVPAAQPIGLTRSRCDGCAATLAWFELVPLLSWAALRGRCRRCGARIAMVHPLFEAGSMLLWIVALYVGPGDLVERLACAFFAVTSLTLLWLDLTHLLLPDLLVAGLALVGLARAVDLQQTNEAVAAALFGGLLLFCVRWLFFRLRNREALGLGDVKLFAALAFWIGPAGVGPALLIAAVTTLAVALTLRLQPAREIPFGPGLLLGAWLVFIRT